MLLAIDRLLQSNRRKQLFTSNLAGPIQGRHASVRAGAVGHPWKAPLNLLLSSFLSPISPSLSLGARKEKGLGFADICFRPPTVIQPYDPVRSRNLDAACKLCPPARHFLLWRILTLQSLLSDLLYWVCSWSSLDLLLFWFVFVCRALLFVVFTFYDCDLLVDWRSELLSVLSLTPHFD